MWVYFIQMVDKHLNPIKIGKSKEPNIRFEQILSHSPYPLIMLGIVKGVDKKILHNQFKENRLEGEWFIPSDEMIEYISKNALPSSLPSSFSSKRATVYIERFDVIKELSLFYKITTKELLNNIISRYIRLYAGERYSNMYFKGME